MDSTTPVTPALLPAQGRQRDGKRQSDPPPYGPRPGRTAGGNGAPPPPQPAPRHKNAMDPPCGAQPPQEQSRAPTAARPRPQHGPRQPTRWTGSRGRRSARPQTPHATVEGTPPGTPYRRPHNPKPSRGEPGPDRPPPQARQTEQGTGAGHAEGHGPRGTALPAPSAGTTRDARATPPSGGGERTPRERERTHTKGTRGDYRKGNRTERAERTDRMEWRTSERG